MKTLQTLFVVAAAVLMVGCGTQKINLAYSAGQKSPLSTLRPLAVQINVTDQREESVRNREGDIKNGYGMTIGTVVSTTPVADVIANALKTELSANGHRVVADGPADVKLSMEVKQCWSEMKIHFMDVEVIGTWNVVVQVERTPASPSPFSKPLNGTFRHGMQVVMGSGPYEEVLNKSLQELIANFSRDAAVLKALGDGAPAQAAELKSDTPK